MSERIETNFKGDVVTKQWCMILSKYFYLFSVTARVHAEIQINETWNQDLTNTSSAAYLDQKNKLETAVS